MILSANGSAFLLSKARNNGQQVHFDNFLGLDTMAKKYIYIKKKKEEEKQQNNIKQNTLKKMMTATLNCNRSIAPVSRLGDLRRR